MKPTKRKTTRIGRLAIGNPFLCRRPKRGISRHAMGCLLAAAVSLAGCASPFASSRDSRSPDFANSVLAHCLADGELLSASNRTTNGGVHVVGHGADGATGRQSYPGAISPAGAPERATVAKAAVGHKPILLSLSRALAEALEHNLAIKFEAYNPPIARDRVIRAIAAFDPSVFAGSTYQHINEPTPFPETIGTFSPIGINNEDQVNSQVGVRKRFATGGTVSVFGSDNYQDFHTSAGLPPDINPSHTAGVGIEIKQPLLKGFGPQVNRAAIYIARRNHRIARSLFRSYVIKIVARVEVAYLQLAKARDDQRIDAHLVARAQNTLRRLKDRLHMDVDAVQINQARAAVDMAKFNLAAAAAREADVSEALKALLNEPGMPPGPGPNIIPTTKIVAIPLAFDLRREIVTALGLRGIMHRDRLAAEKAGIRRGVAKNALLPSLDLVATSDTAGLASDGSYPGAFNQMISVPHIGYSVALKLSFPIGNRAANAEYNLRRARCRQALTRILRDAQNIARDLASDVINLHADWRQVALAVRRERSAAAVLRGLQVQERAGQALDPTFLQLQLNAQQALADAQSAKAQALVTYNEDLVKFQRDKGSLLAFNNVRMRKPK